MQAFLHYLCHRASHSGSRSIAPHKVQKRQSFTPRARRKLQGANYIAMAIVRGSTGFCAIREGRRGCFGALKAKRGGSQYAPGLFLAQTPKDDSISGKTNSSCDRFLLRTTASVFSYWEKAFCPLCRQMCALCVHVSERFGVRRSVVFAVPVPTDATAALRSVRLRGQGRFG